MDGFGRCRTQIDADGDEIELGCLQARLRELRQRDAQSVTPGRQHSTQWSLLELAVSPPAVSGCHQPFHGRVNSPTTRK